MRETIEVQDITKKFGEKVAIEKLSFSLNKGEIFGLLGPNGAGKTTTIRIILGLISPTSGNVFVSGMEVKDKNEILKIRRIVGYVPDTPGFYESLSAYENLIFFGKMYQVEDQKLKDNIENYLKKFDLWERRDEPVATFSKGMKQKLVLARALIHEPEILLLDEPTASLDPEASKMIRDIIIDLKKEGKTILLNTHNLDEATRICDRIGILKTRLISMDTPENLRRSFGTRTVITLENINETILEEVKKLNPLTLEVDGKKIILKVRDGDKEIPEIINAIVSAGGKIRTVNEEYASLEEAYLKLVGS